VARKQRFGPALDCILVERVGRHGGGHAQQTRRGRGWKGGHRIGLGAKLGNCIRLSACHNPPALTGGAALFEKFETKDIDTGETTIRTLIGGKGPPLLLLHGYPQTHVMWHKIAVDLAKHFTVVATDLRGYGDSAKPESDKDHVVYCKRTTAADQVKVMEGLGFHRFMVAGHDRGGRVTHRMCLDYPQHVLRASILDIAPTPVVFGTVNQKIATAYYHWFFLIQPFDFPETLI